MLGRLKTKPKQKVGKYVLGATIGVGGFGVVRKATHEETGEDVAVKILDKAQLQLMQITSQVKREITLFTTLKHPNIVNGFEVLNSPTKLYMVMEFVGGGDMHSLISKRRRIGETESRKYFIGLIRCLAYCHARGVSHRDLKLENLLLTTDGELKVCDFGLAGVRDLNSDINQLCSTIVGTEDFAAPEILQQIPYRSEKADMWSAGIILYTMLAGYCPFRGEDTTSLFEAIKSCRYTFPDGFPAGARQVVSRLLVARPDKRLSSSELLELDWMLDDVVPAIDDVEDELIEDTDIGEVQDCTSPGARSSDESAFRDDVSVGESSRGTSSGVLVVPKKQVLGFSALRKQVAQNPALLLASQTIEGFEELYTAMRQNSSLVKDRRYRLRVYAKTFVGSEMVDWLVQHCSIPRQTAIEMGDRMLRAEVFHHVCRDHAFKDEFLFYRFAEDDTANSGTLNMRQLWPTTVPAREPLHASMNILNSFLALIKIHQAIAKPGTGDVPLVDVAKVREDEAFFAFRMASTELQAVDLTELQTANSKQAFLINLYHIMIMHIRVYEGVSIPDRSHIRERSQLRYNVGGENVTIEDITELLRGATIVDGEPGYQGGASTSKLLSPRAVLPSSKVSTNKVGSSPASKSASSRSTVSSLFTGLSRKLDSPSGPLSNIGYERKRGDLSSLLLNDGSPSAMSVRALGADDVVKEGQELTLARNLLRVMRIDTQRCSLHLPPVMVSYRKLTNLYGERELCLHISQLLEAYINVQRQIGNEEDKSTGKAVVLREEVLSLSSSGIPVHIEYDDYDESQFAPYLEVIDGVADSSHSETLADIPV